MDKFVLGMFILWIIIILAAFFLQAFTGHLQML